MIFAYITGTPALVLPNSNFKVEKCFEWIKECGYIKFVKNPTNENILSSLNLTYCRDGFKKTTEFIDKEMKSLMHKW